MVLVYINISFRPYFLIFLNVDFQQQTAQKVENNANEMRKNLLMDHKFYLTSRKFFLLSF